MPIMQEDKEEVRLMNQMILYSKCMTTRDQQVNEKAACKRVAAEAERHTVEEMEQRRKAALAELEVRAWLVGWLAPGSMPNAPHAVQVGLWGAEVAGMQ